MGMASTVSQLGLCHNWMISVDMDMREEKGWSDRRMVNYRVLELM
jgi:hypothetical protein